MQYTFTNQIYTRCFSTFLGQDRVTARNSKFPHRVRIVFLLWFPLCKRDKKRVRLFCVLFRPWTNSAWICIGTSWIFSPLRLQGKRSHKSLNLRKFLVERKTKIEVQYFLLSNFRSAPRNQTQFATCNFFSFRWLKTRSFRSFFSLSC